MYDLLYSCKNLYYLKITGSEAYIGKSNGQNSVFVASTYLIRRIIMKKLRKTNQTAAQSVVAFACPCAGTCGGCAGCLCEGTAYLSQQAGIGGEAAISTLEQHGLQTANYF